MHGVRVSLTKMDTRDSFMELLCCCVLPLGGKKEVPWKIELDNALSSSSHVCETQKWTSLHNFLMHWVSRIISTQLLYVAKGVRTHQEKFQRVATSQKTLWTSLTYKGRTGCAGIIFNCDFMDLIGYGRQIQKKEKEIKRRNAAEVEKRGEKTCFIHTQIFLLISWHFMKLVCSTTTSCIIFHSRHE